jgi:pyruvate kinase
MMLAPNKTKIVCTIGPKCDSPEIMQQMLRAGMNIARLNFSHGDFHWHGTTISNLRDAARTAGKRLSIMADLPGPKMRIGLLTDEPIDLEQGDTFTLTTNDVIGDRQRAFVTFRRLPVVVKPGDTLFLNDGIIQLKVVSIEGKDVQCNVLVGGELRSHKGLNLPGIDLGTSAFTEHDRECLKFATENGVDAVSQSFVETATDIASVRKAAAELGCHPFIIAKIERAGALVHIDEILKAADGIMIARGDLGVETPIERLAVVQKQLTRKASLLGKPVITATQMLASMVDQKRPTRAESTDVANAILDGTDGVMLSEESAIGQFPVEAVTMLAKIAAATETSRSAFYVQDLFSDHKRDGNADLRDLISRSAHDIVARLAPTAVIIPTTTGHTARLVARFMLPVWLAAVSEDDATCQGLQFSYGVSPIQAPEPTEGWCAFARQWVESEGLEDGLVILTEGPSPDKPKSHHRLAIIDLRRNRVRTNEASQHGGEVAEHTKRLSPILRSS